MESLELGWLALETAVWPGRANQQGSVRAHSLTWINIQEACQVVNVRQEHSVYDNKLQDICVYMRRLKESNHDQFLDPMSSLTSPNNGSH